MEFHTFPQSMQIIYHHNALRALYVNTGNQINFDKSVGQLKNMWLLKRLNYLIYIKCLCISNLSTLKLTYLLSHSVLSDSLPPLRL